MHKDVIANFPYTYLTIGAFLIFLGLFLTVVIWTFRKGSSKYYLKAQLSSLSEGEKYEQ